MEGTVFREDQVLTSDMVNQAKKLHATSDALLEEISIRIDVLETVEVQVRLKSVEKTSKAKASSVPEEVVS